MWAFVLAGIVYLLGVGLVLYMKPTMMFTPDGQWKEFGIGQREDRYSPFPFWLFCLVWAILSYILVSAALSAQNTNRNLNANYKSVKQNQRQSSAEYDNDMYDFDGDVSELPKGYYVLNKKATRLSGIPKYVFLGAEEP
jgi:hypothetical protein